LRSGAKRRGLIPNPFSEVSLVLRVDLRVVAATGHSA